MIRCLTAYRPVAKDENWPKEVIEFEGAESYFECVEAI